MKKFLFSGLLVWLLFAACHLQNPFQESRSESPEETAKPWVFWYWMHGAVTKEAITADLEAMKEAGLGGAYIFSIRDVPEPPLFEPSYRTMTPGWWGMVNHAVSEAGRLGLKLGMNSCDGFTAAGGPWITPEMSMQKVVWADTIVQGEQIFNAKMPQPPKVKNYYKDIAVFAYPAPERTGESSFTTVPAVTTSVAGKDVQFLARKVNKQIFEHGEPCWIQFTFDHPFSCRSVTISTGWNNYQSDRLMVEVSDDGTHFRKHYRLEPPRAGWLDLDANATHWIPPVTSRYFRFVYDPEGSEPGAEDIDDAKWSPALKITGIELSGETKISQFEAKSGAIWRISKRNTEEQIPSSQCVDPENLKDITANLQRDGSLNWKVPAGKWVIFRMGHTSTGHENYVGGGGKGLECDKLNPEVVRFQFDQWFGEVFRQVGPGLAGKVLKRFHVDSWECGSQNWSPVFREEFKKRRGYDLLPYLPVMAGIPVKNADFSERVLADIRQTIAEVVVDNFYKVSAEEAHKKGCLFSAESIAPVMVSDGMLHFRDVDLPMGEFWLNSPSHDKPNDILDAVSGAHIYGKKIVQAESFTAIRFDWNEYPGMMKPVADRNFALGVNKLFFHVFTLNPWKDRKPGMTLDKVGTFFQRDQTWWRPGKAWISYITNCQRLLQQGKPVVDVAVFTGEETPRRAVLPDRLVDILPGIFGKERVEQEHVRLMNAGIPLRERPRGVKTQANMADPENWIDPLHGYAYDSFNRDALLNLAKVVDGRIVLPGGANYGLLVVPGNTKMAPDGGKLMSREVAQKLLDLAKQGATILMMEKPEAEPGFVPENGNDQKLRLIINELFAGERITLTDGSGEQLVLWKKGKGRIIQGPYLASAFNGLGVPKDFVASEEGEKQSGFVGWNHRKDGNMDIYFVANQLEKPRTLELHFRVENKVPVLYFPVTDETRPCAGWKTENGSTKLTIPFEPFESLFVIFKEGKATPGFGKNRMETIPEMTLTSEWTVRFDPAYGGPAEPVVFDQLSDWSQNIDERIRFYSGTATYSKRFHWDKNLTDGQPLWLEPGSFSNMADVKLNGKSCGICWTAPFRVRIDRALHAGENLLEIAVTNTWANRIKGDHNLPEEKRITRTTAPFRLEGQALQPAGLLGPVTISREVKRD
jgi:hypothetical protein